MIPDIFCEYSVFNVRIVNKFQERTDLEPLGGTDESKPVLALSSWLAKHCAVD